MDKQLPVSVWPEWKIVEKIGEGSFGKVYKAKRTEQGKTFYSAIKVITIPSNAGELSSIRSENPDEQSVKEYFHSLVEECIQEVNTMEYFRGNSHVVSVEDYKVVEYLDDIGWDIYIRMEYLTSFLDYCAGRALSAAPMMFTSISIMLSFSPLPRTASVTYVPSGFMETMPSFQRCILDAPAKPAIS